MCFLWREPCPPDCVEWLAVAVCGWSRIVSRCAAGFPGQVRLPFRTVLNCDKRDDGKEASGGIVCGGGAGGERGAGGGGRRWRRSWPGRWRPRRQPSRDRPGGAPGDSPGQERGTAHELDAMEALAAEESRRIGRECLQLALDDQAFGECWLPGVTGSDGVLRARKADSSTSLLTLLGHVTVRRAAYLSGEAGVPALHPRDAVLNLPPGGFSWQFRKLAEMTCRSGTYSSAAEVIRMVTGDRHLGPAAAGDDARTARPARGSSRRAARSATCRCRGARTGRRRPRPGWRPRTPRASAC